ncbi:MAG TPA: M48 family metallopeptidase [archaeon]|nr:M48 family metallopeptidase [archaeon]HLD80579.1 M48 family metallopeptidase [archaeon]
MAKSSFYSEQSRNVWKSWLLVLVVFSFILLLSQVIALAWAPELSFVILVFAIVFSLAYTWYTYYHSADIVLKSTGARPATKEEFQRLNNVVEELAISSGIPVPKIYVLDSNEINAFATGRDPKNAVIVFTTGILKTLNRDELQGVAAHELSHVKNYDVRFMTLVTAMVGIVSILAQVYLRGMWQGSRGGGRSRGNAVFLVLGLLLAIFAPFITRLVQMAVSRKREFLADASGAQMTRYPEGLASALEKIAKYNKGDMQVNEAVSHLFIADPVKSHLDSFFATHPSLQERIKILRGM